MKRNLAVMEELGIAQFGPAGKGGPFGPKPFQGFADRSGNRDFAQSILSGRGFG
jgi:hypothetical protein